MVEKERKFDWMDYCAGERKLARQVLVKGYEWKWAQDRYAGPKCGFKRVHEYSRKLKLGYG